MPSGTGRILPRSFASPETSTALRATLAHKSWPMPWVHDRCSLAEQALGLAGYGTSTSSCLVTFTPCPELPTARSGIATDPFGSLRPLPFTFTCRSEEHTSELQSPCNL